MLITCKFEGGSFKYRLPNYIESLRIEGDVTRRCRKYMKDYGEDATIEDVEYLAEYTEAVEHLFSDIDGVDNYISLYAFEESYSVVSDAISKIMDHTSMGDKKKASLKTLQSPVLPEAQQSKSKKSTRKKKKTSKR